jgi:hypothetical protein
MLKRAQESQLRTCWTFLVKGLEMAANLRQLQMNRIAYATLPKDLPQSLKAESGPGAILIFQTRDTPRH